MIPSLPPLQSALAMIDSGGVEKQNQGSQRMNNIGVANIVILKRPAVTESHELVPAKVFRPQDFCPTLQLTKPAVRSVEKSLAQQVSRNLEPLNQKTTRMLSLLQEVDSPQADFTNTKNSSLSKGEKFDHPSQKDSWPRL